MDVIRDAAFIMRRRSMTEEQMRVLLWSECEAAGSQTNWARKYGVSKQFVGDVIKGRRNVTDTISRALGYDRVVSYVRRAHT